MPAYVFSLAEITNRLKPLIKLIHKHYKKLRFYYLCGKVTFSRPKDKIYALGKLSVVGIQNKKSARGKSAQWKNGFKQYIIKEQAYNSAIRYEIVQV